MLIIMPMDLVIRHNCEHLGPIANYDKMRSNYMAQPWAFRANAHNCISNI